MAKSDNQIKLDILKVECGEAVYHKLLDILSGEIIRFPNRKEIRNQAIWKDFCDGVTPTELAEKYNLTVQMIYKITEKKP